MPFLSEPIVTLARRPRFWSEYLFDDDGLLLPDTNAEADAEEGDEQGDGDTELPALVLTLTPEGGPSLLLQIDLESQYVSLAIRKSPRDEPTDLAWEDLAHWHPDVLRWQELDLICRYLALTEPDAAHPGIPLLLLSRFAPVCTDDDAALALPLLESAWRSVGVDPAPFVQWFRDARDVRSKGWTWQEKGDGRGWYVTAPEDSSLYTLRDAANEAFPWRSWQDLLDALRRGLRAAVQPEWLRHDRGKVRRLATRIAKTGSLQSRAALADALLAAGCHRPAIVQAFQSDADPLQTAWMTEVLLDLESGTVVRTVAAASKKSTKPDVKYEVRIAIPTHGNQYPLPVQTAKGPLTFDYYLEGRLKEARCGIVTSTGAMTTTPGRGFDELSYHVTIRNDLDAGLVVLREALRAASVPEDTRITLMKPTRQNLPL